MTDILIGINYDREELLDTWTACRNLYKENNIQLDEIDELAEKYEERKAIEYYTGTACLSRVVNQVCHTEDIRQIFSFRVYMSDLHNLLVSHYIEGEKNGIRSCIKDVYRGKPLSGSVLQQLIDNEHGLISMNGFLSTTIDQDVALEFAGYNQQIDKGYKSTLFLLTIEKEVRRPYAYIGHCSAMQNETEVLFSLGTIWRIKSVTHTKNPSLGDISHELGNDDEAEWFYGKMLEQDSINGITRGILCYKIGMIQYEKGDLSGALENLIKATSLLQPQINESDMIRLPFFEIFNTVGSIHHKNNSFGKAIQYFEKALQEQNESTSETAKVHDNLGVLYYGRGSYEKAREHLEKSLCLIDESHPHWKEFNSHLHYAKKRCQHLANKQKK
ncbi:unnamed protein product [Rotaria sp. Silwood1]|nr:unnamed protein product [Rotaria sp. Silwood1]